MSNGLKDFMTRLANVYRTATGSTDKIIANTIPDLYEELLENAGSGGSGGGSSIDSWIAGETTEVVYSGETVGKGTFAYPDSGMSSSYVNKITKFSAPNVKTLSSYAFYKRKELTEVNLPNLEICGSAFMYCEGLTSVSFPKLKRVESAMFSQSKNLITFDCPNVEYLAGQTFDGNANLVMTELPSNLTFIGQQCFYGCSKVSFTKIPDGVTKIEGSAFYNCTGLTKIELSASLTELGGNAFSNCTNLTEVVFKSTPTSQLFSNVFNKCTQSNLVIKVPWSQGNKIGANAPWGATNATIIYDYNGE